MKIKATDPPQIGEQASKQASKQAAKRSEGRRLRKVLEVLCNCCLIGCSPAIPQGADPAKRAMYVTHQAVLFDQRKAHEEKSEAANKPRLNLPRRLVDNRGRGSEVSVGKTRTEQEVDIHLHAERELTSIGGDKRGKPGKPGPKQRDPEKEKALEVRVAGEDDSDDRILGEDCAY